MEEPRTELDSHANMVVVRKHIHVLNNTGRTSQFIPFSSTYDSLEKVPVVYAAIAHDCDIIGKTYLLIFHNEMYIQSMGYNLIPPFIMIEANIVVKEVPKIQSEYPDVIHHSI